jgi:hypothetical protein
LVRWCRKSFTSFERGSEFASGEGDKGDMYNDCTDGQSHGGFSSVEEMITSGREGKRRYPLTVVINVWCILELEEAAGRHV